MESNTAVVYMKMYTAVFLLIKGGITMKKVIAILLIVACSFIISNAPVYAVMESTFDAGDEGWWIYSHYI